jgi:uncharacterized protein with HEPN domain
VKEAGVYLAHALDGIGRIERYTSDGREAFLRSDLIQDAVLRNLQTVAQSVSKLSPELTASHREIDWRGITGFRNVIVHDYLGISLERVWEVVTRDLPGLKRALLLMQGRP